MRIQDKTNTELVTSFQGGGVGSIQVYGDGSLTFLSSTARGKTKKITLEEWEMSELVKHLRNAGKL